jgi:predicted nuclease with RNAse H fold
VDQNKETCVLGVDLAGVPHRPTGMCVLRGLEAETFLSYDDGSILECAEREAPALVAIDAPLNLPPGRRSIEDRNGQHFRSCDLELRRRKIRFFPITLGPMRDLTVRGIRLKEKLEEGDYRAVEIYPGAAQDIWGIPRARHDIEALRKGLQRLGIKGLKHDLTSHELDAATGALVGLLFLQNKAEVCGNFSSGAIILPPAS